MNRGWATFFFQLHSLFDRHSPVYMHDFEKLTKFFDFFKIQIPVKLVHNAHILSNFTKQGVMNRIS